MHIVVSVQSCQSRKRIGFRRNHVINCLHHKVISVNFREMAEARCLELEQRLKAIEASVGARLKAVERNHPLEARLRLVEARQPAVSRALFPPPQEIPSLLAVVSACIAWVLSAVKLLMGIDTWTKAPPPPDPVKILATPAQESFLPEALPDRAPGVTFCLKAGMEGYSPSLDIEECDSNLSDRSRINLLHREAVRRELDTCEALLATCYVRSTCYLLL